MVHSNADDWLGAYSPDLGSWAALGLSGGDHKLAVKQLRGAAGPRMLTRLVAAVLVAVLAPAATGCAPQSPDHPSWTHQAHSVLEDAASEVAAMMLLLQLEADPGVDMYGNPLFLDGDEAIVGATEKIAATAASRPQRRTSA